MKKLLAVSVCLAALSACGGTSSTPFGGRGTPTPPPPATFVGNVGTVNLTQGGGYTFSVPFDGDGVSPQATTLASSPPSRPPTLGSATMTGRYDLVELSNLLMVGGVPSGIRTNISGPLTLDVNFATNRVSDAAGSLTVDGVYADATQSGISFSQLTGTVTYKGVTGQLNGFVGPDEVLGVFQALDNGARMAYAGGFSAID